MMKWIGVSTNIAISLKMCLQDLSISERSPRDMTNSNEILKALSLWLAPFYGYLCEMATAPIEQTAFLIDNGYLAWLEHRHAGGNQMNNGLDLLFFKASSWIQ